MAAEQTAGRGRGDNQWHSPPGGLYFSVLLNSLPQRRPTDLVFLAGVALTQTAIEFGVPPSHLMLKWPNDLLVNLHKVAGILAELEGLNSVILGIGVNLSTPKSQWNGLKAKFPPASFSDFGVEAGVEPFGRELHRKVMALYGLYQAKGFEEVRKLWLNACGAVGKTIEAALSEPDQLLTGTFMGKHQVVTGTFMGIDPVGSLMLRDHSGCDHTLISAEILCYLS